MRVTFLMPCYPWAPMGGFKVVYQYANQLTRLGHQVTIVHAREMLFGTRPAFYVAFRNFRRALGRSTPAINWQQINPAVQLLFVPNSDPRYVPNGDVIFATAWNTVKPVLEYSVSKGKKFYLIQHYEACMAPKDLVDETWRAPLGKIVVSKWLLSVGKDINVHDLHYIPNAVDHDLYRLITPIDRRAKQIAMMFSPDSFKGSLDGVAALKMAKEKHPDLRAVFFGTGRVITGIPRWVEYYREPRQEFLVSEIYNKSAIFLSSSWTEGFALPPAEAGSCGCAIVSTNSGGIMDYVEDGETGLLSAPKVPEALGRNLCKVLDDDNLRQRLAENGRKRLSELSWAKSGSMMEALIGRD